MYVVSTNGILLYEGIDKRDAILMEPKQISTDFVNSTLSTGAVDCSPNGHIVFDTKSIQNSQH
jgi:hypothetical protein